jgi:hypothetical protein
MAFSYCPHCGYKNMYSLHAPKFCGGCAEQLNILSAAKTRATAKSSTVPIRRTKSRVSSKQEIDDPEGTDVYEVPNITKLSYSIEQDNNKFSLKDFVPEDLVRGSAMDVQKQEEPKKAKKRGRPRKN